MSKSCQALKVLALAILAIAVISCGREAGEVPEAVTGPPQPVVLEFGDSAQEHLLIQGWAKPTRSKDGSQSWAWATSQHARAELKVTDARHRELHLRASPLKYPNAPVQSVQVSLNGLPIGKIELVPRAETYLLEIPDGALFQGRNVLDFYFNHLTSPKDVGLGPDRRRLAASFYSLRLQAGSVSDTSQEVASVDAEQRSSGSTSRPQVTQIRLGGETRAVLSMAEPWRGSFVVKEGDVFELAYGLTCPSGESCQDPWTFRAKAKVDDSTETLFNRTLDAAVESWSTERVELSAYAGSRIDIELSIERSEADESGGNRGIWAQPLLIRASDEPPINVVLISIDTLRADHLGCYGYPEATSPALDALADSGVRFHQAISQAPWTTPSHMSMMTSQYPSGHHVNRGFNELIAFQQGKAGYRTLPDSALTLAEVLSDHGYLTLALTGGVTMAGELGFSQGFHIYEEGPTDLSSEVESRLEGWLDDYGEMPFFLFFHTFEVHAPYLRDDLAESLLSATEKDVLRRFTARAPGERTLQNQLQYLKDEGLLRVEVTRALYDGGIRHVDTFLGRFFEDLKRRGLDERTMVIVTSDHGEEFGDHHPQRIYNAHCNTLFDELIRVPFIVRPAGLGSNAITAGRVVDQPVELLDLAPTILDMAGIAVPAEMQGQSLKALIVGDGAEDVGAWAVSEATCNGPEIKSFRTDSHKYIAAFELEAGERSGLSGRRAWEKLFDLRQDPGELHNVAAQEPDISRWRQRLEQHFQEIESTALAPSEDSNLTVSPELEGKLRALGYVQ